MSRPIIAMPARFSASASALRYGADVMARALMDAVWAAGGEPVVIHPVAPIAEPMTAGGDDGTERGAPDALVDPTRGFAGLPDTFVDRVAERVAFADGILLPGGGDISPVWTGEAMHDTHYDVDVEQDAFDFALARVIVGRAVPVLAICRGMQLLNVALGGTLHFDMDDELGVSAHRHRVEDVELDPSSRLAQVLGGSSVKASCYHHQCLRDVAPGWRVVARADDGTTEAVELDPTTDAVAAGTSASERESGLVGAGASIVAVQWHPEDTFDTDGQQLRLFSDLVERARHA